MALLNRQKQELFTTIAESGFEPNLFDYSEGPEVSATASLKYRGTPYYCNLSYSSGNETGGRWTIESAPGQSFLRGTATTSRWEGNVPRRVNEWLTRLQAELKTPDPWAALQSQQRPDFAVGSDGANTPLSVGEWEQVKNGTERIRQLLLSEAANVPAQVALINEKLDGLIESGRKMGRVDWFNQAIGMIMNLIVAVSVSSEAQRAVWGVLKATVGGIVNLLPVVPCGLGR